MKTVTIRASIFQLNVSLFKLTNTNLRNLTSDISSIIELTTFVAIGPSDSATKKPVGFVLLCY